MQIDKENKLDFFKDLFANAKSEMEGLIEDFNKYSKQYKGDLEIDGSNTPAQTSRNITYELIESQFSSYLPTTAVTPEVYSERNDRNAKSVEKLLRNKRNRLPFEKMNDIDERYSPIYGGSVWLVEWDNSIKTHNTVGDVKVTIWAPTHFVGQPHIFDIDDMEYCFIFFETTKEDLVRKYGVSFETAEETESDNDSENDETATVVVCYYKDEDDRICQYIWSGDTELLDIEDYYTNTERSELMRSDSDIVRSFTMFTSVPLKQLSRLVESFGEYNALRSLIKSGDSDPTLSKRYKLAKKKIRRTLAAVTIANLMYVLVGQFFKFLYNNMAEDDEEGKVTAKSFFLDMLKDFGSTTIGMLPVVRDIYGYFVNGYEIENFTGDMLNSIISSAKSLFELATKAASGEEIKTQEYMSIFRNSLYSIGQVTGIPVRNINNTITGLVRRFSPSAAYSYTSLFYNPKYSTDIKAALKKGDYELAEMIMGMLLKDDRTGSLSSKATQKLIELYDAGYTVLPKSIGNTLTYNGETVQLTAAQQSAFKTIYSQANAEIEKLVNSAEFATLPAERQAKAIKLLYDAYYSKAQASVLKQANDNKIILLSGAISPSTLAPHLSAISAIESDTDKAGNVINGSKKAKVIKYVMAQKLDTVQKLLLILSLG